MKVAARFPADGSVVDIPSLELVEGERFIVFGPNGAGKTTLLRLLAGVMGDEPQLDAAYMPQQPYLFRGSAGWNLGLGLTEEEAAWAGQHARTFGLADQLTRPASQLSGGERQRLCLARTLATSHPWVLLDEPLSALDVADRGKLAAELAHALEGRSAIIVTHDRDEAAVLGDRVGVMVDGQLQQLGSVQEVFSLPSSAAVAEAVGVGNVVEGTVAGHRDGLAEVKSGRVVLAGVGTVPNAGPARAIFGAEAVTLYRGRNVGAGSAVNHWEGTVTDVRHSGRMVTVLVDVGIPMVALITPGSLDALGLASGAPVTAAVKATAVRIIPA